MSLTVFGKHRINNFKFLSLKIQTFLKMLRHGLLFQRNKITEIAGQHIKLRFSKFVRED